MATSTTFEYTCTLSPETLEVARTELNEDPETRMLELKAFRDRLQQHSGLHSRLDPPFLVRFLRASKWDQEKAFTILMNYYRMRSNDPEIFTGLKPSALRHVYQSHLSFPHSHRDRLGRKVYLVYPARQDYTRYSTTEVFKAEFINLSKMSEDEENQVRGYTLLLDYKDFSMSHFMQLNLAFGKRLSRIWQDAFPARLKNCLIVNEPPFIDLVLGLFTQFIKDKIVSRIRRIGTDWKTLHEYIDPDCLPPEYGGTLQTMPDPEGWVSAVVASDGDMKEEWIEELVAGDGAMEEESRFGLVDLTVRDDSHTHQDAMAPMTGTFKKLNV